MTILVLSMPLFVMVLLVGMVEGFNRRDLRRYGAGYESSFVYHHAKRFVKPAFFVPCMIYLSRPSAIYPNLVLLPAALLFGLAVAVATASFKNIYRRWAETHNTYFCVSLSADKRLGRASVV